MVDADSYLVGHPEVIWYDANSTVIRERASIFISLFNLGKNSPETAV